LFFLLFFLLDSRLFFHWCASLHFRDQAGGGQREVHNKPPCADGGRGNLGKMYAAMIRRTTSTVVGIPASPGCTASRPWGGGGITDLEPILASDCLFPCLLTPTLFLPRDLPRISHVGNKPLLSLINLELLLYGNLYRSHASMNKQKKLPTFEEKGVWRQPGLV